MTLPATPRRAGPFTGNGVATAFPFTFKVFADADIRVIKTTVVGIESTLVLNADYTVTVNADQEASPGGVINYSALAVGEILNAIGNLSYDQTLDLPSGGNFNPTTIENAFDRIEIQVQQLKEVTDRAAIVPVGSTMAPSTLVSAVLAVAANETNIDTVASLAGNIDAVVADAADINMVAGNIANINMVAGNLGPINAAALQPVVQTFSGTGSQTAFTLSVTPGDENNTQVFIGGVYQQKSQYSLAGNVLTFSSAPASGTNNIEVITSAVYAVGGFIQGGTGAITRTVETELRERVTPKQFGADPTGVLDSTAAFRAAYQYLKTLQVSKQGTVYDFTMPSLDLGSGKYLITGSITQATGSADSAQGLRVVGDNAILFGGVGTFNFFEFRTNCDITGVCFQGGGRAFLIQTGNSDSAKFNINGCVLQNQTVECFSTDTNSASTILNVSGCKIYQVNGGPSTPNIATVQVDTFNLKNNWIYYGGTGSGFYTTCTVFNVEGNLFVPNYLLASGTQRSWFYNSKAINLLGNRFGGEAGGCTVVEHYGDYSGSTPEYAVIAKHNAIYCANTSPFKFYKLPTSIRIEDNFGYDLTPSIVDFDTGITPAMLDASMRRGAVSITDVTTRESQISGNTSVIKMLGGSQALSLNKPAVADLIISANTNLGAETRIGTNSGADFYSMGGGREGRRFIGPTDSILTFSINATGITEITTAVAVGGWLTVVYYLQVLSATPISGYATIGSKVMPVLLNPGDNLLSYQLCRVASTLDPNVEMRFAIKAADDIVVGPLRVFKNACQVQGKVLKLSGAAAPASGRFFVGESVEYDAPAAAGFMGVVCTTSGAPGTWKTYGAISA